MLTLPPGAQGLVRLRLKAQEAGNPRAAEAVSAYALGNAGWQMAVDAKTGGLSSLREQATGREWVAGAAPYTFGQFIHETIIHPVGREAVHTLGRYAALGIANQAGRRRLGQSAVFAHHSPYMESLPLRVLGPVFDSLALQGQQAAFGQVLLTWRCYHAQPLVELVVDWNKNWCQQPEAAYVAFPFAAAKGQLALETGGGFFQPGSHGPGGQLPGTCANYYTVQRAAKINAAEGARLLWLPLDAPL